ncbi:MAG: anthranilate phosphoribosyltransferase [Leptospirillia bacterium]
MGALTHAIGQVGRGASRATALTPEEAGDAMGAILDGRADPFELGAFLVAMRIKEETAGELVAFVRAAQDRLIPFPGAAPLLTVPSYAGKRQTFPALIGAACVLAACGVPVGLHGHATPPERISMADVLGVLGCKPDDAPEVAVHRAADDLKRAGVAYLGVEQYLPAMHRMLELRRQMGLRSCFHTMGRLINPFGASALVVGLSHERTFGKFAEACKQLGYKGLMAFRGLEGEAEGNPFTATEGWTLGDNGEVTGFEIDPAALGNKKASRGEITVADAAAGAHMLTDALNGEGPEIARDTIALTAAAGLVSTAVEPDIKSAFSRAREAIAGGDAHERLRLWLG